MEEAWTGTAFTGLAPGWSDGWVAPGDAAVAAMAAPAETANGATAGNAFVGTGMRAEHLAGQRLQGVVRKFQAGWGFIVSDSFEGDLFVGGKSNRHLPDGALREQAHVVFTVSAQNGKAEASNVEVLGDDGSPVPTAANVVSGSTPPVQLLGQKVKGVLRSFRDSWGFAVSEQYAGDVFVHTRSNPKLQDARPGDVIEFILALDDKLQHGVKAQDAELVVQEQSALVGQRVTGTVKLFRDGWGFLNSPRFTGDVFIGTKAGVNPDIGGFLVRGESVSFEIQKDTNGGYCAVKAKRVHMAPQQQLLQVAEAAGQVQAVVSGPAVGAEVLAGLRIQGWVKSFRGSWGFLNTLLFPGDIFIGTGNNPHITSLQPGEAVEFEVSLQGGRAAAVNVKQLGCSAESAEQRARSRTPAPQIACGSITSARTENATQQATLVGQTVTGWVKSFRDNWGFLNSGEFPGDVFVGLKSNPALDASAMQPNQQVSFEITRDAAGKMEAINVMPF